MPNGPTGYPSTMVTYRVNEVAVKHARKLIDAGTYDDTTEWSDAAPSAADANKVIDEESFDEFSSGTSASTPTPPKARRGASRSPTATSPRSTGRRSSTPSSAPRRTTTTRSRRPPTTCCSDSTTNAS